MSWASQISHSSLFKAILTIRKEINYIKWKKEYLRGAQSVNCRSSRAAPPLTSCVRTASNMRIKFLKLFRDTSALLHSLCICLSVHTSLSSFSVYPSHMQKRFLWALIFLNQKSPQQTENDNSPMIQSIPTGQKKSTILFAVSFGYMSQQANKTISFYISY